MFSFFTQTVGRFHPLVVHLPIGILLLAALFYFLSKKEKYRSLERAVTLSLLIGFFSALLSVITGYGLSLGGDYATDAVVKHQWTGILTVLLIGLTGWLRIKKQALETGGWCLMLAGLILTGHWGGSLTHGEGYLKAMFQPSADTVAVYNPKPIPQIEEAVVYTDIIQPILEARCYSCHGPQKQKGKLRLDQPDFIAKGGEEGKILSPGNPEQSALIGRLFLPIDDKDHMPPREKPQPGPQELDLLHWWVKTGGSFTQKVKDGEKTDAVKTALAALQEGKAGVVVKEESVWPEKEPPAADPAVIRWLIQRGWAIAPLAQNTHYLSANSIGVDSLGPSDWENLKKISAQVLELRLGHTLVKESDIAELAAFPNLYKLSLEHTLVADPSLAVIGKLNTLRYLNLSHTRITPAGLSKLAGLPELRRLYVYNPGISGTQWWKAAGSLSTKILDTGGYKVPVLASDTTVLTKPPNR